MTRIVRRKMIGGKLDGRELLLNESLTEYSYNGELYALRGGCFVVIISQI